MITKWEKNEHGNWKGYISFVDETSEQEPEIIKQQTYYEYFWSFFY